MTTRQKQPLLLKLKIQFQTELFDTPIIEFKTSMLSNNKIEQNEVEEDYLNNNPYKNPYYYDPYRPSRYINTRSNLRENTDALLFIPFLDLNEYLFTKLKKKFSDDTIKKAFINEKLFSQLFAYLMRDKNIASSYEAKQKEQLTTEFILKNIKTTFSIVFPKYQQLKIKSKDYILGDFDILDQNEELINDLIENINNALPNESKINSFEEKLNLQKKELEELNKNIESKNKELVNVNQKLVNVNQQLQNKIKELASISITTNNYNGENAEIRKSEASEQDDASKKEQEFQIINNDKFELG